MRKLLFKMFALCAAALALCGLAACSKRVPGKVVDESNKLKTIDPESVILVENEYYLMVSWEFIPYAEEYKLTIGDSTVTTTYQSVNLRNNPDVVLPSDGVLNVKLVASGTGYADSDPTEKTLTAEGIQLRSPEILSFENGVLTWSAVENTSTYRVKINGANVSDGNDGLYHATSINLSDRTGELKVEITAVGDGVYFKDGTTTVRTNAEHTKLLFGAVSELTVKDGVLSWGEVGGAKAYMLRDIDNNTFRVEDTSYDMFNSNIITGVYPVSGTELMGDATVGVDAPAIKYLEGEGTTEKPYLIKTPFDLRAVDYYEQLYAENKAADKKTNNYRIENDIEYDTVSEGITNIVFLNKPLYGTLDGNGKKLSNIIVTYNDGYWALFDHITPSGTVKNITFESPDIYNDGLSSSKGFPIAGKIATVAYENYGTITGVTVTDAKYTTKLGDISGIASKNFGTISNCTVKSSTFKNSHTTSVEFAGIAVENGGTVKGCSVSGITKQGSATLYDYTAVKRNADGRYIEID